MELRPLTLADRVPWARLLATCFERSPEQMEALLTWFHDGFPLVTMGAWDGARLVAQYNCRLLELRVPGLQDPAPVGMGLNMAVDPAYRGRGLLDRVSAPVHDEISARGCLAGVGFSSGGGLDVTKASRNYAYDVLGPMVSLAVPVARRRYPAPAALTDDWPEGQIALAEPMGGFVRYMATAASLQHRFAKHPFRRYRYAVRSHDSVIDGLVVYRATRLRQVLPVRGEQRHAGHPAPEWGVRRNDDAATRTTSSPGRSSPIRPGSCSISTAGTARAGTSCEWRPRRCEGARPQPLHRRADLCADPW